MEYYLLQSGSSGNSCLIISHNTKILIDCGVTYSSLLHKLKEVNTSIDEIDAVLITHEHIDHIKCIDRINPKIIYATKETLNIKGINYIRPYEKFDIKNIHLVPLSISHDIANGVGFLIDDEEESLVYITDTGYMKKKNFPFIKNATHYVLESNYDEDMLENSRRPRMLKNRISSKHGHLSNIECGEILSNSVGNLTKTIVLAHISGECNTKNIAINTVESVLSRNNIDYSNVSIIASDRHDVVRGYK